MTKFARQVTFYTYSVAFVAMTTYYSFLRSTAFGTVGNLHSSTNYSDAYFGATIAAHSRSDEESVHSLEYSQDVIEVGYDLFSSSHHTKP